MTYTINDSHLSDNKFGRLFFYNALEIYLQKKDYLN